MSKEKNHILCQFINIYICLENTVKHKIIRIFIKSKTTSLSSPQVFFGQKVMLIKSALIRVWALELVLCDITNYYN